MNNLGIFEFVRNRDSFGQSISLKYLGRGKYKTKCGGLLTILIRGIILTMTIGLLITLATEQSHKSYTSKIYIDTDELLGD